MSLVFFIVVAFYRNLLLVLFLFFINLQDNFHFVITTLLYGLYIIVSSKLFTASVLAIVCMINR